MNPTWAMGFVTLSLEQEIYLVKLQLLQDVPVHERSHWQIVFFLLVGLLEIFFHKTFHPALRHHNGSALIGDVAGFD